MRSTVRISIALFIGYMAYFTIAFLAGDRPDEVGGWVRLLIKGFLIVVAAIATVEWLTKRNAGAIRARVNARMSSESQAPRPTVSGPPTAG